jgi:hypothetical protein
MQELNALNAATKSGLMLGTREVKGVHTRSKPSAARAFGWWDDGDPGDWDGGWDADGWDGDGWWGDLWDGDL